MTYTQTRPSRSPSSRGSRSYSSSTRHSSGQRGRSTSRPSTDGRSPHRSAPQSRFGGARRAPSGRGGGRKMSTFDVSQFINRNPVSTVAEEVYTPTHRFQDFQLERPLLSAIMEAKLQTPTPIQDQIIPHILAGRDVVGLANTGTGKTAAFLIPLINLTLKAYDRQTLILTPTRELAIQIEQELKKLSLGMKIFSSICVGGTNIRPQIQSLKRKNHFIVGTPGRVQDLIDRRAIRPATISTVVLDEADRMLDMGFIADMKQILKDIPTKHETLFFSATMSSNIEALIHDFLHDPIVVSVKKKDITTNIEQDVVHYGSNDKFTVLVDLLKEKGVYSRVLLFGAMKHSVEKLGTQLNHAGITAESIHGNKSHPQRQRALNRFKDGQVQVLVATDVASRGIHVDDVSHVINYDLPATYEDYVHRIGRTGRGAKNGKALTFVV